MLDPIRRSPVVAILTTPWEPWRWPAAQCEAEGFANYMQLWTDTVLTKSGNVGDWDGRRVTDRLTNVALGFVANVAALRAMDLRKLTDHLLDPSRFDGVAECDGIASIALACLAMRAAWSYDLHACPEHSELEDDDTAADLLADAWSAWTRARWLSPTA